MMEMQIGERKALTQHSRSKVQSVVQSALRIVDTYIHYQFFSFTKRFTTDRTSRKSILAINDEVKVMAKFLTTSGVVGSREAKRISEILNVFAEHADYFRSNIFTRKQRVTAELIPLQKELAEIAESCFKTVLYDENYRNIGTEEDKIDYTWAE